MNLELLRQGYRDSSDCRREFLRRLVSGVTKDAFRTEDGDFDLTAFKACLKENDIEPPKVDEDKHGWRGRFRMCAGLMLRSRARKAGFVVINGKKIAAHGVKKRGRNRKAKSSNGGEPQSEQEETVFEPLNSTKDSLSTVEADFRNRRAMAPPIRTSGHME